ncbi:MAG: DmsC/YnfH family molybdoenzyme membrane anchor subunit [Coriobacteriales bacterium]
MAQVQAQEHVSEAPLVLFTVCVPAAVGVAACAALLGGGVPFAALALAVATLGMAGSIFHLARPLRAPGSLRNLPNSRLSQEIGAVIVFWLLLALWLAAELLEPVALQTVASAAAPTEEIHDALPFWASVPWDGVSLAARVLAAAWGVALLWVVNRAYRVPTRPAWDGPEGLMELLGIACGLGPALYVMLACALALAAGGWGEGGTGAVAPLPAPVPVAAAVLALVGAALAVTAYCRRHQRLAGAAAEDERLVPVLEGLAAQSPQALYALCICVAPAVLELVALLYAVAPSFASLLLLNWVCIAALQLAAAILQRTCFYEFPAQEPHRAPLRK